ncbi:hypothetical protein F4801DRAFT_579701 [Xylaria longipes]|nr:hypothetical protein F4801DRAFT_579701 [Xylaria longipes]
MAEALSTAASGIAVAAQGGKTIIKLKQLWDDFKDVPSSIGDLLNQIDCLDPALWEAENTFSQASLPPMFWDSSLRSRSTTYCHKALRSLKELVDELTLQLNRPGKLQSKVATAKVLLKKEQLRSLERRLQNAITMSSLSQRSYLIALTRLQPHIVIQSITESKIPLITQTLQDDIQQDRVGVFAAHQRQLSSRTLESADNEQLEDRALTPRRYTNRREDAVSRIRFRLPTWVCRATWELQSFRSYGNWQFKLRYYHTVSGSSEVFITAEYRTPKELQMLFASGRASPYDRNADLGYTLLHCAVWGQNRPMVKYLMDVGLSPFEGDHAGAPIAYMITGLMFEDLVPFLADWSFTDELNKLSDAQDFLKTFRYLECPQHEETALLSRLRSLERMQFLPVHPMVTPELLRRYWTQDLHALCIASMAGFSLIHIVARGLGEAHYNLSAEWASLAETVISNTPNIHHIESYGNRSWLGAPWRRKTPAQSTPLMVVIKTSSLDYRQSRNMNMRKLFSRVTLWLSKVQSSGHNLEDWKILWSFPEKDYAADYAADFWRLVEDGPQLVPGAWVEDSDDEGDDD